MGNNIIQESITPVKPKVLEKERVFVYVEEASDKVKGIASFDYDHFLTNKGNVKLNIEYFSEAPFDRFSLLKLDRNDFLFNNRVTQINWSYAHDKSGSSRTNGFGLVKIEDDSAGYLKFTDDENHYLEVDKDKLGMDISEFIEKHNLALDAHPDIRNSIEMANKAINNNRQEINNSEVRLTQYVDNTKTELLQYVDDTKTEITTNINDKQFELIDYINYKVSEIKSIQIRNMEPNLVINATNETVQEIATQYILDNYDRSPETNDGLFITRTDLDGDIVEYAYFNNVWVDVGTNSIKLADYVDLSSTQTITGNKNFNGILTKNGIAVATINDIENAIVNVDTDSRKLLILGATGTIGTKANFVVSDAESFIPFRNNLTEFIFSGIIPVTGEVDLSKEVTIDFGDTSYYVYDAVDISKRLTLGDLNFALKESLVTGYNYLFRTVFFNNAETVGFAVLPARDSVLSLNSDQMDNYLADGGLPNGQLAICNRVITNGYNEGSIYRFKIEYPNTYSWEELSRASSGSSEVVMTDNVSIRKNNSAELEAISLKNKVIVNNEDNILTANFDGIVDLTTAEYNQLIADGQITLSNGQIINYSDGTIYITDELEISNSLTLTQTGAVVKSSELFNRHILIALEFETDGMHYGADFILHPYDSSICLVQYSFTGHTGTAYLDEAGHITINVPDGLTFTNIKGHFIELGG